MKLTIRKIVVSGILGAVAILLGVTPLGLIAVPTPLGHATILHIPAILGGVLEGPVVGLLIGFIFGLISFIRATLPMFSDPLVAILPRLFIGITAYLAYAATRKINPYLGYTLAGIVGTATNTVFVLGMAVIRDYLTVELAVTFGLAQGIPEMIVATVLTVLLVSSIKRIRGFEDPAGSNR
ncbi:MAG TPA: ECF transporter S component [Bacillota bacterium]|nr:ECF transporter S component [Bacillota bacterium]